MILEQEQAHSLALVETRTWQQKQLQKTAILGSQETLQLKPVCVAFVRDLGRAFCRNSYARDRVAN